MPLKGASLLSCLTTACVKGSEVYVYSSVIDLKFWVDC